MVCAARGSVSRRFPGATCQCWTAHLGLVMADCNVRGTAPSQVVDVHGVCHGHGFVDLDDRDGWRRGAMRGADCD